MAAKKKSKVLQDLFLDTLKDIYYAEQKIAKALPKMAKAAQDRDLKSAFEKHLRETEGQIGRLEQVFGLIDETAKGKKCPAIDGIIKEGDEIGKDYKATPALDAGLLSARAVGGALRDFALRHAADLGAGTWHGRGGQAARADARRGEDD